MLEVLKILKDTPLPSILVIGGLAFLLLPFLKRTGGAVEIETDNRGLAALIGMMLLLSGIALYVFPAVSSPYMDRESGTATPRESLATMTPSQPVAPEESYGSVPPATTSPPVQDSDAFCPPMGSPEAMFSIPLEEMGDPIGGAVGTGVFEQVVRPFGTRPTPYQYAKEALQAHPCVQYLTPSVLLNQNDDRHCMISSYHTNRIWVGSVLRGTSILVEGVSNGTYENIGTLDVVAPDTRAYLVEYEVHPGDQICVEAPQGKTMGQIAQAGGYHLWIGRDLKIYTDSWCLLLENDNTAHWCN